MFTTLAISSALMLSTPLLLADSDKAEYVFPASLHSLAAAATAQCDNDDDDDHDAATVIRRAQHLPVSPSSASRLAFAKASHEQHRNDSAVSVASLASLKPYDAAAGVSDNNAAAVVGTASQPQAHLPFSSSFALSWHKQQQPAASFFLDPYDEGAADLGLALPTTPCSEAFPDLVDLYATATAAADPDLASATSASLSLSDTSKNIATAAAGDCTVPAFPVHALDMAMSTVPLAKPVGQHSHDLFSFGIGWSFGV
ncbi:hypothetical protein RI367_002812 [Sorochytrium milnesiophthora]